MIMVEGNEKLPKSKESCRFKIFDLPTKETCPESTNECRIKCYATGRRGNVAEKRWTNYKLSKEDVFVENIIGELKETFDRECYKKATRIICRIHSAGDFYDQTYFDKWLEIINKMNNKGYCGVTYMAYTKSVNLVDNRKENIPENFIIRYSIWSDTNEEQKKIAEKLQLPIYEVVDADRLEEMKSNGYVVCPMKDINPESGKKYNCIECGLKCYDRNISKIVVRL